MNDLRKILFSPPDIGEMEIDEVIDTLKSGWLTTGPKTKLFEKELAKFCNTKKAVAMNSATACLEMTLRLLGVGYGDEVITSAYTYTATASVIQHVGAKVVLVDTKKNSFEMDYDKLSKSISSRTKVIIPVDIAGVMCDYDKILKIVREKDYLFNPSNDLQSLYGRIIIMADAAHSFGAYYNGRISGEVADFTCFSFHAVKNLTTGEGGAVTWKEIKGINGEELYKKYMLLSLHGQSKDALEKTKLGSWEYDIKGAYYKCNMTDIMASLGLAQLKRYPSLLSRRKKIVERYNNNLKNLKIKYLEHFSRNKVSSCHLYFINLFEKEECFRNEIINELAKYGIATNVHYKPLPMHSAYKKIGFDIKNFPNAFNIYKNVLSLPMHTLLKDEDIDYICDKLKLILDEME